MKHYIDFYFDAHNVRVFEIGGKNYLDYLEGVEKSKSMGKNIMDKVILKKNFYEVLKYAIETKQVYEEFRKWEEFEEFIKGYGIEVEKMEKLKEFFDKNNKYRDWNKLASI